MATRIVFMGTPDFAVPSLEKLAAEFHLVGVITQPDRPAGRGRQLVPTPVKEAAQGLGLDIYQPQDVNSPSALSQLQDWDPDLICVAAFGQILGGQILDLPEAGCLNVHASLLPRWRGAAPINAAILAGDEWSGATIMKMGPGLDDGPVITQKKVAIGPQETAGSLFNTLAQLGGDLLVRTIPPYLRGEITPQPQDSSQATYASMLTKKAGELDFRASAQELARKVRAFNPWPGTYTYWQGSRLLIHFARAVIVTSPGAGVFSRYEGLPAVGTGEGILVLEELQLAGKSRLTGQDFLNGTPSWGEPGVDKVED
ncbi:MAG: methionyl-tRNA formyltransferase [Anaerolineales bacterium]